MTSGPLLRMRRRSSMTGRSDLIDLTVILRRETDKAWGIASEDKHGEIVWLPKSMCEISDHNAATGRAELTCPAPWECRRDARAFGGENAPRNHRSLRKSERRACGWRCVNGGRASRRNSRLPLQPISPPPTTPSKLAVTGSKRANRLKGYPMANIYTLPADPMRLPREVPRHIVETRALFLARETANIAPNSPTRRQCLEQLTRSKNSAISAEALRLLAPLRMMK